jgi:hypothetical protein
MGLLFHDFLHDGAAVLAVREHGMSAEGALPAVTHKKTLEGSGFGGGVLGLASRRRKKEQNGWQQEGVGQVSGFHKREAGGTKEH